jgi:hypothetical protein
MVLMPFKRQTEFKSSPGISPAGTRRGQIMADPG